MHNTVSTLAAALLSVTAGLSNAQSTSGATYATPETRVIIERMVEAHGGLEAWHRAQSFRYTATMYLSSLAVIENGRTWGDNWRVYTVTIDPHTGRGHVALPLEDGERASVGFDGAEMWRTAYTFDPPYQDGPLMLLHFHASMITLPWLTQLPGVELRLIGPDAPLGYPTPHDVVEMTFQPEGGYHGGAFRLYIDRETSLLRAWEQTVGYPILPGNVLPDSLPGGDTFNGMMRVVDSYGEIDGLTIPRTYTTVRPGDDGIEIVGAHIVLDPSFAGRLDPARLRRPADATVVFTRQ